MPSRLTFYGSLGLSGVALPQSAQRPLRKSSKTHFLCDLCGLPHQMPENPFYMHILQLDLKDKRQVDDFLGLPFLQGHGKFWDRFLQST